MRYVCFLFCLALFAGCAPKHVSERNPGSIQIEGLGPDSGIMLEGKFREDGTLNDNDVRYSRMDGHKFNIIDIRGTNIEGIKKIQISLKNETGKPLYLQYQFVWMDTAGMDINANYKVWLPVVLYSHQTKHIVAASPSSAAEAFRAYIRLAAAK